MVFVALQVARYRVTLMQIFMQFLIIVLWTANNIKMVRVKEDQIIL